MPSVEYLISVQPLCGAQCFVGFSPPAYLSDVDTQSLKLVDSDYFKLFLSSDGNWPYTSYWFNQWQAAALPGGSVIQSYEVTLYGFYDDSPGDVSIRSRLGKIVDTEAGIVTNYTGLSSTQTFVSSGTPSDYVFSFSVSASQSSTILNNLSQSYFGLYLELEKTAIPDVTSYVDAITLKLNYSSSDATFRARGGSRSRLLWGVR